MPFNAYPKDHNRYSVSRLNKFKQCPRQYKYVYDEGIEQPETEYTLCGSLLHYALELAHKGEALDPAYDEWHNAFDMGRITSYDRDQLEYTISHYMDHYKRENEIEIPVAVEHRIDVPIGDHTINYLSGIIDYCYTKNDTTILRDIKTTSKDFKYQNSDMLENNEQLLLYVFLLKEQGIIVQGVEIDEIKFGKIEPPPLLKNGTPSKAMTSLAHTTADEYRNTLDMLGLSYDAYKDVIEALELRGHPFFRRNAMPIVDDALINSNLQDLQEVYNTIKTSARYKVHGPLCRFCAYNELCRYDNEFADDPCNEEGRAIVIDRITKQCHIATEPKDYGEDVDV